MIETDHDLLLKIDAKVTTLCRDVNRAYEDGFPRCAAREERIEVIEDRNDKVDKIVLGACVTAVFSCIGFLGTVAWAFVTRQ